jgi:hypothetical protein
MTLARRGRRQAGFLVFFAAALVPPPSLAADGDPAAASCRVYGVAQEMRADSQLFAIDLRRNVDAAVGEALERADVEGLAAHPRTSALYAVSGQQGAERNRLHRVDGRTGELTSVGAVGFDQVRGLAFRPRRCAARHCLDADATLWAWSSEGLVRIDAVTGDGSLVLAADRALDALAWSPDGRTLYGLHRRDLFEIDFMTGIRRLDVRLRETATAMTMRPDGRLLVAFESGGSLSGLAIVDPVTGEEATTFDVPAGRQDVRSITWPLACGNPSPGGRADMIADVEIDRDVVCPGETIEVDVEARHPEGGDNPVHLDVNGTAGGSVFVQFRGAPGPRYVQVTATTFEGHVDTRTVAVEVVECDPEDVFPTVFVARDLFDGAVGFHVANPEVFGEDAVYLWDFGDGSSAETDVPYARHFYSVEDLERDALYTVFQGSVTARVDGEPDHVTPKTVTVWNDYFITKRGGVLQPPTAQFDERMGRVGSSLVGHSVAFNPEDEVIRFTSRQFELQFCDRDRDPELEDETPYNLLLNPRESKLVTLSRFEAELPEDVCGLGVRFRGASQSGVPAELPLYFTVRDAVAGFEADPVVLETLNRVADLGLVPNPDRITTEQLWRLAAEGLIEFPGGQADGEEEECFEEGCVCNPHAAPPEGFLCAPTDDFAVAMPHIANARKGELILSTGCGTVAKMLGEMLPRQVYEHEGIMTRHYDRIAQSTVNQARITDPWNLCFENYPHICSQVLQVAWPGSMEQSVEEAFLGQRLEDPDGETREIDSFNTRPITCGEDATLIRPKVLQPGPEQIESGLVEDLREAADLANETHAHYRVYGYSQAAIALDPDYDELGTIATVSSTFIWQALRGAGVELEGEEPVQDEDVEVEDEIREPDITCGPRDGLYCYSEENRLAAAEFLYNDTINSVCEALDSRRELGIGACPELGPAIANQVVNCFAFDSCDVFATGEDAWRDPGEGETVSPDDFQNWDPYPRSEPMIFRGGVSTRVYRLVVPDGVADVSGFVLDAPAEEGGAPIEGARVTVSSLPDAEAFTDELGAFTFVDVPTGGNACFAADKEIDEQVLIDQEVVLVSEVTPPVELVLRPSGARRVVIQGEVHIVDQDPESPNEEETVVIAEEVLVDTTTRTASMEPLVECTDEVRTELHVDVTLKDDDVTVEVNVFAELFEKIDCGDDESEDDRTESRDIRSNEGHEFDFELENEDPLFASDKASFNFVITNLEAGAEECLVGAFPVEPL